MVLLSRSAAVQGSLRSLLTAVYRETGKLRGCGDGYILCFRYDTGSETGRHIRGAASGVETGQRLAGRSSPLLGHDDRIWRHCANAAYGSARSRVGESEAEGHSACAFGTYSPVREPRL